MSQQGTDTEYRSRMEVSDPKSPTWRYRCNANGVPIAGTLIGIQGCQWISTCCSCIIAAVNHRQKRGADHHSLIKETADLWRSVFEGNQETKSWFQSEVEKRIEQFVATEDQNILLLMQNTVKYTLLRLYLASNASLGDVEQNEAIRTHMRRSARNQEPDDDSWASRSIYASARSTATPAIVPRTPAVVSRPAPAAPRGRPPGASGAASVRSTRATQAAQPADAPGGSTGAEDISGTTARAETTAGAVEEDLEEQVSHGAPSTSTLTTEKSELVLSLLSAIQSQDPIAITHFQALMDVASPPVQVVQAHPATSVLTRWATSHGFVKPGNYKESCETGGISIGTYLFLDQETQTVMTLTYEPWDMLTRIITQMFLRFRCAILTNTRITAYRTTQTRLLPCGAKVREDKK